jgi:YD repeat-containing protein
VGKTKVVAKGVAGVMEPALERLFVKEADDVAAKAAREAAEEAAEKAAKEAAEKTGREAGEEATERAGKKAGENAAAAARPAGAKSTCGDPIDVATGDVTLTRVDVDLAGVLPLVLERTHISGYRSGELFGVSWASTLDQHLELDAAGVAYAAPDGMILQFPRLTVPGVAVRTEAGGQYWQLVMTGEGGYTLSDTQTGRNLHFPMPSERTGWVRLPLTAITDRNGNRIDLVYDEDGTLVQVRHSCGYRIAVDTRRYGNAGVTERRITALRLHTDDYPAGVILLRYGYDEAGNLAEVINASGNSLRYGYDDAHRITGWTDRNGCSYSYTYDDDGRVVSAVGTAGFLGIRLSYDPPNTSGVRRTVTTDSLGHVRSYEINTASQIIAETDPLGGTIRSEWDRHHQLMSRSDALVRTVRYAYDDNGNLNAVTRPDGLASRIVYSERGLPVELTEPGGAVWRHAYDDRGNLVRVTGPDGAVTAFGYDGAGRLTEIRDQMSAVTRVETDLAGLPVTVIDPRGQATRFQRDAFGRVSAVTDPVGGVTRCGWTVDGAPSWRRFPDGATERWSYDAEGNLVEYIDPIGRVTRTEIGPFDLPTSRTGPDGRRLEFGYDTELNLISVTNPQGLTWHYAHDAAGRLTAETDFDGRTLRYRHDECGRLVARTNGLGQTVTYSRDALGNIIEKHSDGQVTTFTYDTAGRLLRAVNATTDLRFERDPMGRVTAEICNERRLTSRFDASGRRITRRSPSGAESTWTYDATGLPTSLAAAGQVLHFVHDAAGRETQRRLGTAAVLTQQWDEAYRLTSQTLWGVPPASGAVSPAATAPQRQPQVLQHRSFTYLANGDLTVIADRIMGDRRLDLDPAGRVVAVHADGWSERYAYDAAGNLAHAAWPAPGAADGSVAIVGDYEYGGTRVRRAGRVRYEYDANGRMVLRQEPRLSTKPATWRFHWDSDDHLVGVQTPDGTRWRYLYDALGRRVAKQRLDSTGGILEQIDFAWDGLTVAEQSHAIWSPEQQTWTSTGMVWDYEPGTFRPLVQIDRAPLRRAPQQ